MAASRRRLWLSGFALATAALFVAAAAWRASRTTATLGTPAGPAQDEGRAPLARPEASRTLNTCPICGRRSVFRQFRIPTVLKEKEICGSCGAFARHRLLYLFLQERTDLFTKAYRVIEFSPTAGLAKALRAKPNLRYVTSEYGPGADLDQDLTNLKLPDGSFDVAICFHVLEHIPDDRKAMRELYRILEPGGWAVVQVPLRSQPDTLEDPAFDTPRERLEHYRQEDHVRYYGAEDFADRLTQAGFQVQVVQIEEFARSLGAEKVREYALRLDQKIYLLRKREARARPGKRAKGPTPLPSR